MRQLLTERLILSPFLNESELFLRINTDPHVRKYLWDDKTIDLATANSILEENQKLFDNNQYGLWKIVRKEGRQTIGYTGLWYFFDEPQPQLIYAILPAHGKNGYAAEAARAIISYAFEHLGFNYLIAATDEPHVASQRVAKRLGMTYTEKRMEDGKPTLFYRIENRG